MTSVIEVAVIRATIILKKAQESDCPHENRYKDTDNIQTNDSNRNMKYRQQLEQALDHIIDGCQIISPDFRYMYVNRTVAKQGHNTRDELLGHTMMEVYPGIEHTRCSNACGAA